MWQDLKASLNLFSYMIVGIYKTLRRYVSTGRENLAETHQTIEDKPELFDNEPTKMGIFCEVSNKNVLKVRISQSSMNAYIAMK